MNSSHLYEDPFSILAIIKFLALGIPCILILSYMNNVPMAKKCLLLYLYKDAISSFLLMRSIWMIKVLLEEWNVVGTNKALALTVSFVLWMATLYMAVIMIFISIYKLYMAKTKTIDPKVPFLEEDEVLAIRKIRIWLFILIFGFLAATFAMGWYPSSFYALKPDEMQKRDLLISNTVYRGTVICLLLVSGSTTIAMKYYKTSTELQMDQVIPKAIKYMATFFPAMFTIFTLTALIISEVFPFPNINTFRKIYSIIISIIVIVGPFLMIYKSKQLKTFSTRFLKDAFDDVFMLSIYLVPSLTFFSMNILIYVAL